MPENPTLEDVMLELEKAIAFSRKIGQRCIRSLWVTEAEVILENLKKIKKEE